MHTLPADAPLVSPAVSVDAVTDASDLAQLVDVEVEELAGYQTSVLTENRSGLVLGAIVSPVTALPRWRMRWCCRRAEPRASSVATVGADKGDYTALFVVGARALGVTPHGAAKAKGGDIAGRTTRHDGYAVSQRKRKAIEEVFG